MKTNKNKKSGFTLVELMIVAAIIAILAAIVIPLLANNRQKAIASEGQTLLGSAATQYKLGYADTGSWPTTFTNLPAKYFGDVSVTKSGEQYELEVKADEDAGDLKDKTLTLNYKGEWGGGFESAGIIKK